MALPMLKAVDHGSFEYRNAATHAAHSSSTGARLMRMLSPESAALSPSAVSSVALEVRAPPDGAFFVLGGKNDLDATLRPFFGGSTSSGALRFEPVTGALTSFGLSMRACFVLLRVDAGILADSNLVVLERPALDNGHAPTRDQACGRGEVVSSRVDVASRSDVWRAKPRGGAMTWERQAISIETLDVDSQLHLLLLRITYYFQPTYIGALQGPTGIETPSRPAKTHCRFTFDIWSALCTIESTMSGKAASLFRQG